MFSYNLNDFVLSPIIITDMEGKIPSEYNLGKNYIFKINFQETAQNQWQYYYDIGEDKYYLMYQLPSEIKIPKQIAEASPYPIWGLPKVAGDPVPIVGYYSIDINGLIKVKFDDVNIYGEDISPINFIDYYTDATFTLEIIAQFANVRKGTEH